MVQILHNILYHKFRHLLKELRHFPFSLKTQINAASSIDELRGLLNFNTSEDELVTRGLTRQDFSMRVGQSTIKKR